MQVIVNGLISGLSLAVLASAFSVVYLPTRVFFLALAAVFTWAPYLVHSALSAGAPIWGAMLVGLAGASTLSVGLEVFVHRPLLRRRAPEGTHLVSSLGCHIVLVQAAVLVWGKAPRGLRQGLDPTYELGSVILTQAQVLLGLSSLAAVAVFLLWLQLSGLGMRFRAMFANRAQLALLGYDTGRLTMLAFGVAGLMAGWCAVFQAYNTGFDPNLGLRFLILAIVAVIIGGRSSFVGPILGAIFLGILRTSAVWHFSSQWQEVLTFLVLLAVLLIRPRGLLGGNVRLEASQ